MIALRFHSRLKSKEDSQRYRYLNISFNEYLTYLKILLSIHEKIKMLNELISYVSTSNI